MHGLTESPMQRRRPARRVARPAAGSPTGLSALLAILGLGAGLTGCSGPAPTDSYFPLEAGHRWTYSQRIEWDNNAVDREELVMHTDGADDLPTGESGFKRRSDSGMSYWLRADETGTYRVASKTDLQAEPEPDRPPRYVLKLPLAVGTTWQAQTTAYLLKRNAEFPPEIRHTHAPVIMTYQIVGTGEAVSTEAGDFADCIKVEGNAAMRLFANPVAGFQDMPLITTEWYCKGVGLVKLQRQEPSTFGAFLQGGTLVMELVNWE